MLGVKPIEAGYKRVSVCPNLCDLTSASGVIPTPHGDIAVEWREIGGKIVGSVKKPKEISVEIADGVIAEITEF